MSEFDWSGRIHDVKVTGMLPRICPRCSKLTEPSPVRLTYTGPGTLDEREKYVCRPCATEILAGRKFNVFNQEVR